MSLRIRCLVLCSFALFAATSAAAGQLDVFGGFTVANMKAVEGIDQNSVRGWNTAVTLYPTRRFGITADVAGFYSTVSPNPSNTEINLRQYSVMAGPQVRLFATRRFDTSVRALVGVARGYFGNPGDVPSGSALSAFDQTKLASLFGSNIDFHLSGRLSLRFSPGLYITQFGTGETQKNMRFSFGPVFHFGGGER